MKLKFSSLMGAGLLASVVSATPAYALTTALVTFEPDAYSTTDSDIISISSSTSTSKALLVDAAPSIYVGAGTAQTINTAPATFNGGVLLGLATFFPAQVYASGANVYGTADFGIGLKNLLTISTNNAAVPVNEVSFALFNGETFTENYNISIQTTDNTYSTTISNIAANWQSGFALVDLIFPSLANPNQPANILSVSISSALTGGTSTNNSTSAFDFLIDSVAFNQPLSPNVVPTPVNPPPIPNSPPPPPPPAIIPEAPQVLQTVDSHNQKRKGNNGNNRGSQALTFVCPTCTTKGVDFGLTQVQAVPEPESYAMMIAGFGVMGFVARRRRVVN